MDKENKTIKKTVGFAKAIKGSPVTRIETVPQEARVRLMISQKEFDKRLAEDERNGTLRHGFDEKGAYVTEEGKSGRLPRKTHNRRRGSTIKLDERIEKYEVYSDKNQDGLQKLFDPYSTFDSDDELDFETRNARRESFNKHEPDANLKPEKSSITKPHNLNPDRNSPSDKEISKNDTYLDPESIFYTAEQNKIAASEDGDFYPVRMNSNQKGISNLKKINDKWSEREAKLDAERDGKDSMSDGKSSMSK